jgi:hypothetical protein
VSDFTLNQLETRLNQVRDRHVRVTTGYGRGNAGAVGSFVLDTPLNGRSTLQALCLTPCSPGPVQLYQSDNGQWYAVGSNLSALTTSQVSQLRRRSDLPRPMVGLYFLVDASASFESSRITTTIALLDDLAKHTLQVRNIFRVNDLQFGLGTFSGVYEGERDPIYSHRLRLNPGVSKVKTEVRRIQLGNGREHQLQAIFESAKNPKIRFDRQSDKVILCITDECDFFSQPSLDLDVLRTELVKQKVVLVFLVSKLTFVYWLILAEYLERTAVILFTRTSEELIAALKTAKTRSTRSLSLVDAMGIVTQRLVDVNPANKVIQVMNAATQKVAQDPSDLMQAISSSVDEYVARNSHADSIAVLDCLY